MVAGDLSPREERRVVTVLFADLVGFTERSEDLDPEDVRAFLARYYRQLRAELERHGGTVDKFIGDAVMAVFGAPVAHEDDPERAVRAALAVCEWARREDDVRLRVGVNTGEVLVGLEPDAEGLGMVAGDVVNTASRLQAAASVNGVLVGETTYRATREIFAYREHDPIEAKGKASPVPVWEPLEARAGIAARRRGDAELVGRKAELESLTGALERARRDLEPGLVTLVGVPGIGKSRLVEELRELARGSDPPVTWLEGRSLPYGTDMSFWALAEMVKAYAGIMESDEVLRAESALRGAVEGVAGDPSDRRWLEGHLRPLLGLEAEAAPGAERRADAFAAWRRFLELLAKRAPLVVVFDDLHWADDGLLDFVEELGRRAAGVPLLVLATARPELLERRPEWGGRTPRATTLALTPLSEAETMELVRSLARGFALDRDAAETLLRRAQGNPLYAEEFVRAAAAGDGKLERGLPDSIHGLIAARLDSVGRAQKELLQDAAVIGHSFWTGALSYVGRREPAVLEELLPELERKEFVSPADGSAVAGELEYAFRHPLVREVAYAQIPRGERAAKHLAVAEWTESLPSDRAENRAALVAHHFVSALDFARATGLPPDELEERTARALREAGDRSRALYALETAASQYRAALELTTPGTASHAELALAVAEVELRAGDVEEAHRRLSGVLEAARALGRADLLGHAALALGGVGVRVGDPDDALIALLEEALEALGSDAPALRARLLARLAVEVYYVPPASRREELSEEALRLAREADAADALADALNARHAALWAPDGLGERLAVARELVELAERIGDRERSLQARTWLVLDLVESRDMDGARRAIDEYARLAEPLGIPAYAWWVSAWRAMLAALEGRFDDARRLSTEARETGARAGDANAELYDEIVRWQADMEQGSPDETWLPMLEKGIARGNAASAYTCGLAFYYALLGRQEEARRALDDLGPEGFASVPRDMNWLAGAAEFTGAVGLLGDRERAEEAYRLLLPYADRNLLVARAGTTWGPAESFLGRLAATAGLWDEAERHFEAGLDACERMGARAVAARTRDWYARMLRSRARAGDSERAEQLERRLAADADELGLALSASSR